jgi:aspartate/methionine/tyrosine aminotransferase
MNHILSDRINNLATSQTLAMAALARELKAQGKDIISLSLGEPDFNTPDFIKEAAKRAIDENYSTYSPVDGYQELKEAVCRKFKRDNGLDYKPSQIVVSTTQVYLTKLVKYMMVQQQWTGWNKSKNVVLPLLLLKTLQFTNTV